MTTLEQQLNGAPPEAKFPPGTIQTYTGEAYNFANPDPESIKLKDIQHALSNMCRFAGHTKRFYSVAEHSVFVSWILEAEGYTPSWQIHGLLHDAHEAYIWDCPRPLKPILGGKFEEFAAKADAAIGLALHVQPALFHSDQIKHADDVALVYEAEELMYHGTKHWTERYAGIEEPPEESIKYTIGLSPPNAEILFTTRCEELGL